MFIKYSDPLMKLVLPDTEQRVWILMAMWYCSIHFVTHLQEILQNSGGCCVLLANGCNTTREKHVYISQVFISSSVKQVGGKRKREMCESRFTFLACGWSLWNVSSQECWPRRSFFSQRQVNRLRCSLAIYRKHHPPHSSQFSALKTWTKRRQKRSDTTSGASLFSDPLEVKPTGPE